MDTSREVTPANLNEILPQLWQEVCQVFGMEGTELPTKVRFVSPEIMSLYTHDIPPAYNIPGVGILLSEDETITVGMLAHELAHFFTPEERQAVDVEIAVSRIMPT